jgi:hypothetical protein
MSVPSRTVNLFQAAPSVCRFAPFAGTLFGSMQSVGTLFGGPPWAVAGAPPSRPQAPQRIVARAANQPWPSRTFSFERTPYYALRPLTARAELSAHRARSLAAMVELEQALRRVPRAIARTQYCPLLAGRSDTDQSLSRDPDDEPTAHGHSMASSGRRVGSRCDNPTGDMN